MVPVYLYGQSLIWTRSSLSRKSTISSVIEDACRGAEHFSRSEQRWRNAGSMGKAAVFSFLPWQ